MKKILDAMVRMTVLSVAITVLGCCPISDRLGIDLAMNFRCKLKRAAQELKDHQEDAALNDALGGCEDALSYFEVGAASSFTLTSLVALGGAVSGGIVVPMLSAAAANANRAQIAAWGGVSGVANTAQLSLNTVQVQSLQIRESIRSDFKTAMDEYEIAHDENARRAALTHVIEACFAYPVATPSQAKPSTGNH